MDTDYISDDCRFSGNYQMSDCIPYSLETSSSESSEVTDYFKDSQHKYDTFSAGRRSEAFDESRETRRPHSHQRHLSTDSANSDWSHYVEDIFENEKSSDFSYNNDYINRDWRYEDPMEKALGYLP